MSQSLFSKKQNIVAGLTIIAAVFTLALLILIFAALPRIFKGGYRLSVITKDASGLSAGSSVSYNGVPIGTIESIRFNDSNTGEVDLLLRIESKVQISTETNAYIRDQILGDLAKLSLLAPHNHSQEFLSQDGTATLVATRTGLAQQFTEHLQDNGPFAEIEKLTEEASTTLANINEAAVALRDTFSAKPSAEGSAPNFASVLAQADNTLMKLELAVNNIETQIEESQALENIATAASDMSTWIERAEITLETAESTLATIQTNAQEITNTANAQMSSIVEVIREAASSGDQHFASLESEFTTTSQQLIALAEEYTQIAQNLQEGKGTAGRMLVDPALYENLNASLETLNIMMNTWRELAERIQQEGIAVEL